MLPLDKNMNKILLTLLLSMSFSTAFASQDQSRESTIENLITHNDFKSLKTVLYDTDIDVLDRANGYSLLDYAMNRKNKRAAIILADYNNSSIPERNIIKIKNTITYLESEITKNTKVLSDHNNVDKNKAEINISQLQIMKESLMSQIKDLETKVGQVSKDERITKLEKEVQFLMQNFISIDDDKSDLKNKLETTKAMIIKANKTNC